MGESENPQLLTFKGESSKSAKKEWQRAGLITH